MQIHFDTMKVFAEITPTADVKELLYILSHASELSDCVLVSWNFEMFFPSVT